jgi:dTDP-4-amino-4,6-dideoxygalactose transaminase
VERAEIVREKGTDRRKFFRGEVDKYTWVDIGSSYLPSELVAAFLYAQLEECDTITRQRRAVFDYYVEKLAPLEARGLLRLPRVPAHCEHNAHMLYVLLGDRARRDALIAGLARHSILGVFHYVPLHTSPMGRRFGYAPGDLPRTEDLSGRVVRLPCYFELDRERQDRVIAAVTRAVEGGTP